jgi:multidrug efflux pump subunit AcrB
MRLPEIAIKNRQFVFILILLGIFIGINALVTMPRSEDPNTSFPIYNVVVVYPGTGPEDMEELVVDPLEEALDDLDDIVEIKSLIRDGIAIITVEAEFGIDYDEKYDDVVTKVNSVKPDLPDEIYSIDISQFSPAEQTIIQQFALTSDTAPYHKMEVEADKLESMLERLDGIRRVEIEALPEREVRVSLDFQKIAQQNIAVSQVLGTLAGNNANIPGGDVKGGNKTFTIKSSGGYKSLDQLQQTVVSSNDGNVVYLRDIATIDFDYQDQRWIGQYNGDRSIFITVTQEEGANILQLQKQIDPIVANFQQNLSTDMKLASVFEQAPAVKARISDFFNNLVQGILLVGVVIFVFLGWRPSLIIMLVIPISILMAIGALDFSGFALQQISIAALVIALGLLVDNGIVVMENIIRLRKQGLSKMEAAVKGTSEVGYAIISSTITTLLAFAPLAFMQSGPGEYLRSLPVTVILVLLFSLILALLFSPILSTVMLPAVEASKTSWFQTKLSWLVERVYTPLLGSAMGRPWIVLTTALVTFVGSVLLFPLVGVSFFPTADKPVLLIEINTPEGSNLEYTQQATEFVNSVLDTTRYVSKYATNIGHGNPQIYYNRIPESYNKSHGQVLVTFKDWHPATFYHTLFAFREIFDGYPGARITFRELKNGPPFEAPIEIKLIGQDLNILKSISEDVEQILNETEGTWNIENPLAINKTDLRVKINRDKAGIIGLPLNTVDVAVRASLAGIEVDKLAFSDGEEYPMIVRVPFTDDPSVSDFSKVYLANNTGDQLPLNQVAQIEFEQAVPEILHFNLDRSTSVTADVNNPDQTTAITLDIIEKLDQYEFPAGYRYYVGGEYENQQESFGDLGKLLVVALIGIFAVLVLQFRSISQPLIVFSAIPLAITGSFIALFLTGWSFSFFAFVGFISLMGIVVNNSIILVDYANKLMKEGKSLSLAIQSAAHTRFIPIVLTTTTTIVGLLPLTLSNTGLWSPLGWTIIGGMISSTLLTLFLVPVLYQWFTKTPT